MAFSRINDLTVHWSTAGREDRPAIVFSNSLGTDMRIWSGVADRLAGRYRLVTYDSRGHGLTDAPAGPYSITGLADDLLALADANGLQRFALVGLSVGGIIAQQIAARAPERLTALVLCNTAAKVGTTESWNARIEAVRAAGMAAIAGTIMERWFSRGFRDTRKDELAGWHNLMTRTPVDGYIATCEAIRDADLSGSTASIVAPTLVVVGEEDGSTPPDLVKATADRIPGARFEVIKNAAHMPGIEQPELLAGLIRRHLTETGHV